MPTSIRLAAKTEERLERLATNTGRTKAYYLREMIEKGLEDMEDLYDAEQFTLARRAGRASSISQQEMEKLLGMGD